MLTIIGGPMFSGKTTWLIKHAGKLPQGSFVLFKPDIDTRYREDAFVTHDGLSFPAVNLDATKINLPEMSGKIKTILIDELNFFSPHKVAEEIKKQIERGRDVIGAGLIYDYKRLPFGATLNLSKVADKYIQLYAKCDGCEQKASNSYRKVHIQNQFLLGSKETYGACCDDCWTKFALT